MQDSVLSAEMGRFIQAGEPNLALIGPPGCGKSWALGKRVAHQKAKPLWLGTGMAEGMRHECVRGVAHRLYEATRLTPGLFPGAELRPVDFEEFRRLFQRFNEDDVGDRWEPWMDAYEAAKSAFHLRRDRRTLSVLSRMRVKRKTLDREDVLHRMIARTDKGLLEAGLCWPGDLLGCGLDFMKAGGTIKSAFMMDADVLAVDDMQLLTGLECAFLMALVDQGARLSATIGDLQNFNAGQGGVGRSAVKALNARNITILRERSSRTISPGVAKAINAAYASSYEPRVRPSDGAELVHIDYLEHPDEETLHKTLTERLRTYAEEEEDRSSVIVVPNADLIKPVREGLAAQGIQTERVGRSAGESSAGFIIANSITQVIRNPRDMVAMRQVGTLFGEVEELESRLRDAHDQGVPLNDLLADDSAEMIVLRFVQACSVSAPSDLPAAIRSTPSWPTGDPDIEGGLDWWAEKVRDLDLKDWRDPQWEGVLGCIASRNSMRPSNAAAVSIAVIHDTAGMRWGSVDLVGFSQGLLPAPCSAEEEDLENDAFAQVLTRAKHRIGIHHCAEMRLRDGGPLIKLSPSSLAFRSGLRPVNHHAHSEGVAPFRMSEKMR